MKRLKISLVGLSLILPSLSFAGEPQSLKMKIEGMTCGFCVKKVQSQLSSLCKDLMVDREKGEAVCKYEPPATSEQILSEANKTGFKTTKIN
jgi:copper chaperone CopZ